MLADFLSKPLQGGLFRKFRDVLLALAHLSTLRVPVGLPGEERVAGRAGEPGILTQSPARESLATTPGSVAPIRVELDQQ